MSFENFINLKEHIFILIKLISFLVCKCPCILVYFQKNQTLVFLIIKLIILLEVYIQFINLIIHFLFFIKILYHSPLVEPTLENDMEKCRTM